MKAEIGSSVKRFDFDEKIDGSAKYTADMRPEGMLFARTLRSIHPRAILHAVKVPKLPEGYSIIDHRDITGDNVLPVVYDDWPIFAEREVNYVGDPIMLVVGPDKAVIEDILSNVEVHYEVLKPYLTLQHAMQNPPDYAYEYAKGNIDSAIIEASKIVEDTYTTGYQEQAYMEPQSVLAFYENGIVTVKGSMQCPYYIKNAILRATGFDDAHVRVIQLPTGGGFGGKEEFTSLPAVHAALASIKTGSPVMIVYERREDLMFTTKRHPSEIKLTSYLDAEDRIIGRTADVKLDVGAYMGLSSVVLQRLGFAVFGVYNIPNIHIRARAFKTNNVISGAFRGFGAPQANFAIESHMNHLAKLLDVNPMDFKRQYFLKKGDTSSTGGNLTSEIKLTEIIEKLEQLSNYRDKYAYHIPGRGIGFSVYFHGCGFTGSGEKDLLKTQVRLKKYADDRVEIFASSAEMGQGAMTTLAKIVSSALDIPLDHVIHKYPDTDTCPDSGPTVASRTIMIVGKVIYDLCIELKKHWSKSEYEITKIYEYPPELVWNNRDFQGNAYPDYAWGGIAIEVDVDPLTYVPKVTGIWTVNDIGVAIDEKIVKGQIDGGFYQGLGYAAMEQMDAKGGVILQNDFSKYIIPGSDDYPEITCVLIDNPYVHGPFGAKGLGELTTVGTAAAYTAAVENATGIKITSIPVTPEYIREAMKHVHHE